MGQNCKRKVDLSIYLGKTIVTSSSSKQPHRSSSTPAYRSKLPSPELLSLCCSTPSSALLIHSVPPYNSFSTAFRALSAPITIRNCKLKIDRTVIMRKGERIAHPLNLCYQKYDLPHRVSNLSLTPRLHPNHLLTTLVPCQSHHTYRTRKTNQHKNRPLIR